MLPSAAPPRHRTSGRQAPAVLGAPVFRSVLTRERKRAERSGCSMVLALLSAEEGDPRSPGWSVILARLAAVVEATDVVGWYESGARLGLLRTTATANTGRPASAERSGGHLAARLDQAVGHLCSIRVLVHPEPVGSVEEDLHAIEPGLYPELVFRRRADRIRDAGKRMLDIAGSLVLLLLLAPVLTGIGLLVKMTSPGPALFAQTRLGYRARPFTIRKFRTMHQGADPHVHREFVGRLISARGDDSLPATGLFKLTNDQRITRMGRFLRKTSLDELPQLWNVLRGDMSLVGPRPPVPYEYAQYQPWHRRRIVEAKPGMTGLWQVVGRSRTTFDEMVRLDLRYARTRTLRKDLAIIGRTPSVVISGKGAC